MNIWQAVIMAIVEGITEFLPISSTAHLELTASILRLVQNDFVKSFEIAIQLGAIFSVAILYVQKVLKNPILIWKIIIAFAPTGILGLILYKLVKSYLLGNEWVAITTMFLGGLLLLKFEVGNLKYDSSESIQNLSVKRLLSIGIFQSLAMVPGVSRALATIWGGELVGLSRAEAVEMSFLLAVPTMAAATGLDLIKSGTGFSGNEWMILGVGFAVAFVSAAIVIKWLVNFVKSNDLRIFGWYRVFLAVGWLAFIVFR